MEVRADLHRAVAGIGRREGDARAALVELDLAVERERLAGLDGIGGRALRGADRLVDGDELGAVRKHAFDLQDVQHGGDARHHVGARQDRGAESDQVRDGSAVAGALEDFVGDDRDGLGVVHLQPAGAPLPGEFGGREDGEAFEFGRGQQHFGLDLVSSRRGGGRLGRGAPRRCRAKARSSRSRPADRLRRVRRSPEAGGAPRSAPRPRRRGRAGRPRS